jgi:hypothetical protein
MKRFKSNLLIHLNSLRQLWLIGTIVAIRLEFFNTNKGSEMNNNISLAIAFLLSWVYQSDANDTLVRIAVYKIKSEILPDEFTETLTDQVESKIIGFSGYRVISRSNLDVLIIEDNLSQSGVTGPDDIRLVQAGPRSSVDKICTGSISRIGQSYSFTLKIIDVGSGRIDAAAQKLYNGSAEGLLKIGSDLLEQIIPHTGITHDTITVNSITSKHRNDTATVNMNIRETSTVVRKEVPALNVPDPQPIAATGPNVDNTTAVVRRESATSGRPSELGRKISIGAVVIFGTLAALVLFTRNH